MNLFFRHTIPVAFIIAGLTACDITNEEGNATTQPPPPAAGCENCDSEDPVSVTLSGQVSFPGSIKDGLVCADLSATGTCSEQDPRSSVNRYGEYSLEFDIDSRQEINVIAVLEVEAASVGMQQSNAVQSQLYSPDLNAIYQYFNVTDGQVTLRAREHYGHISPITEIEQRELDKFDGSYTDIDQHRIASNLSNMFNVRAGSSFARAVQQSGYIENLSLYSEVALLTEPTTDEPLSVPVTAIQAKLQVFRDPTVVLQSVVESLLIENGYQGGQRGGNLSYNQMASVLTQIDMDNRDYNAVVMQADSFQVRDGRNRVSIDITKDETFTGEPEYMDETCWSADTQRWESMRGDAQPNRYVHTIRDLRVTPDSGGITVTNDVTGYSYTLETKAVRTDGEYFTSLLDSAEQLVDLTGFTWPEYVYWLEFYDVDYVHACVDPNTTLGVPLNGLLLSEVTAEDVVRLTNPPAFNNGTYSIGPEGKQITYETSGAIYRFEVLSFSGGLEVLRQVPVFSPDGNAAPSVSVAYEGELVPIFGFADGMYEDLVRITHQFVLEDSDIERLSQFLIQ